MEWKTLATVVAALALTLPAFAQTEADEARRLARDAKLDAKRRAMVQQARYAGPRLKLALKLLAEQGIDAAEFEARFQQQQINATLARRMEVDFGPGTSLAEACEFLRMLGEVDVVLAPGCDPRAECALKRGMGSLREGIQRIASAVGLEWSLVGSVVYLHPRGATPPLVPEVDAAWRDVYGAKAVELNFSPAVRLSDGAEFLERLCGAKIEVDRELAKRQVQVLLRQQTLPVALTLLADQLDATWTVEAGKVLLRPRR